MSTYIDPSCLVPAKKWEKLAVLANSLLSKLADRKMSTYIDHSCLVPAKKWEKLAVLANSLLSKLAD